MFDVFTEVAEKGLHHGVTPTVSSSAHAWFEMVGLTEATPGIAPKLGPLIRVAQGLAWRLQLPASMTALKGDGGSQEDLNTSAPIPVHKARSARTPQVGRFLFRYMLCRRMLSGSPQNIAVIGRQKPVLSEW
jgi:hypothetical protein